MGERLGHFNADGEVFSTYIFGILDGDESYEEKETNLCDLLEGLGLEDGSPEPCQRIQTEIWTKWNSLGKKSSEPIKEEGVPKADLGAALAAHAETQTKAYKAKGSSSNPSDDKDREAVKAAILAQYGNSVVEESDEEEEDDDEHDLGSNTNAEAVAKAQQDQRERSKLASQAKKDKDKEDREKQKKDAEDRKKKAQEKAAKGERKR